MKQKVKEAAYISLGFVLIALAVYAVYRVGRDGWHSYKSLSDNVQIALAVAFLSLVGSLGTVYYTKTKERQLQIEASHTSRKQVLYDDFLKDLIELLADPAKSNDEEFSLAVRKKFMSSSLLWSNAKVLKVYHQFRQHAQQENSDSLTTMDIARLLLAFRDDLGLSNKDIDEQTILEILYDKDMLTSFGLKFDEKSDK